MQIDLPFVTREMGHRRNHKRVHRVYCALGLNQKRGAKRRLPNRPRQALTIPGEADSKLKLVDEPD